MGFRDKSFRKGKRGQNKAPLRKIVGLDADGLEILECGHHQWPRYDFVGHTNAERRRCRKCKAANQADDKPST